MKNLLKQKVTTMNSYLALLRDVIENGERHEDRTGVGTRSVFGRQFRHDMRTGFPLLTTKKVALRWVFEELRWFLSGSTNVADLHAVGVTIWDEWLRPYNSPRELVVVDRREATLPADYYGDFKAGEITSGTEVDKKLGKSWRKMMERCYDKSSHNFSMYGAKGCTVHPSWHNAAVFIEDVKNLPHWAYKLADWNTFELDSDYYGANQYGPKTCVWLSSEENNKYTDACKVIKATDGDGQEFVYFTFQDACRGTGITAGSLGRRLANGKPKTSKQGNKKFISWEFEVIESGDKLIRKKLIRTGELGSVYGKQWRDFCGVDQIGELLETIERNPNSRRMMVSAWNPSEVHDQALPPCHAHFQLRCHFDGTMSLHMYMRSCDIFLGLPFNIASYAMLLEMLCFVTGYTARDLVISFGDLHLYNNHVDQANIQLERKPYALPSIRIDAEVKSTMLDTLLGITWNDVIVAGYKSHPKIEAPVAV